MLFSAVTVVPLLVLEDFLQPDYLDKLKKTQDPLAMPWPGQTEQAPVRSQVIADRLLNYVFYLKRKCHVNVPMYDLDESWLMSGHFEEQTDKLASACTCPCRHTLKLLNSWFFFFLYVTVNNEYGMSSNHPGTKKSSTKRTGKTMQIKWDFFLPHP